MGHIGTRAPSNSCQCGVYVHLIATEQEADHRPLREPVHLLVAVVAHGRGVQRVQQLASGST
jgi:hypothetical protein